MTAKKSHHKKVHKVPNYNKIRVEKTLAENAYWESLSGPVTISYKENKDKE